MSTLLALSVSEMAVLSLDTETGAATTWHPTTGPFPDGICVHDGAVYWTTMGRPTRRPGQPDGEASRDFGAMSGSVRCRRPGDVAATVVLPDGAITTGKQLATDGEFLYWCDREGAKVSRCRMDGSQRSDLVVNSVEDGIEAQCVGIALDSDRGHLYWSQKGPAKGGRGRIFRTRIPAADEPQASSDTQIELLWSDLPEPIDLEVHRDHLYWSDRGREPRGNTLNRAPLPATGVAADEPEILASGFHEAIGLAIDPDAEVAYVSDLAGTVRRVPLPGSGASGAEWDLGGRLTGLALL